MAAKFIVLCASALLVQSPTDKQQPIGRVAIGCLSAGVTQSGGLARLSRASRTGGVVSVLGSLIVPRPAHHGLSAASAAAAAAAAASGAGAASSAAAAAAASASSAAAAGAPLVAVPDLTNILYSGPLLVTSVSPIAPIGLSVTSENVLEGLLEVKGILPFASAVAFEGALETAGSGAAGCGCGTGTVGITEINCN